MESLNQHIREYKKQLEKGHIQKAYQGILHYLMDLRLHFQRYYTCRHSELPYLKSTPHHRHIE